MQPILVAHGATEGQTRKVAEFVAECLRLRGHAQRAADEFLARSGLKPLSVRRVAGAADYTALRDDALAPRLSCRP